MLPPVAAAVEGAGATADDGGTVDTGGVVRALIVPTNDCADGIDARAPGPARRGGGAAPSVVCTWEGRRVDAALADDGSTALRGA